MSALRALIAMSTQRSGGSVGWPSAPSGDARRSSLATFNEGPSSSADDIGHLQERPAYVKLLLYLAFLFSG
jgi:hypothetical protein